MTVLNPRYLDEILTGLRSRGHVVCHILFDATADVLRGRIAADQEHPSGSWREVHIAVFEAVRAALSTRGRVIDTNARTPPDVAAAVVAACPGLDVAHSAAHHRPFRLRKRS